MFTAEWPWQGVWHSFPFVACTQGHRFDISTNLYALEHVHVVQILIMHINALKTQLMHKNVERNPEKSPKYDTTLLLFYVDTRKNLKQ